MFALCFVKDVAYVHVAALNALNERSHNFAINQLASLHYSKRWGSQSKQSSRRLLYYPETYRLRPDTQFGLAQSSHLSPIFFAYIDSHSVD